MSRAGCGGPEGRGGVNAAVILSALLVALGAAAIVRTVLLGVGGGYGLLVGALLIAAGSVRLYLARKVA